MVLALSLSQRNADHNSVAVSGVFVYLFLKGCESFGKGLHKEKMSVLNIITSISAFICILCYSLYSNFQSIFFCF